MTPPSLARPVIRTSIGQGTCSVGVVSDDYGNTDYECRDGPIPAGHSLFRDYIYTADPSPGWHFVEFRFEIEETKSILTPRTGERTITKETHNYTRGSLSYTRYTYTARGSTYSDPTQMDPGSAWWYDWNWVPGLEQYDENHWVSAIYVTPVFVKDPDPPEPPREPTHLLVNSADLSTPVQLVYDPNTNLLVADY